jgi:hypothetical protein
MPDRLAGAGAASPLASNHPVWLVQGLDKQALGHQALANQVLGDQNLSRQILGNQILGNQFLGKQSLGKQSLGHWALVNLALGHHRLGHQVSHNQGSGPRVFRHQLSRPSLPRTTLPWARALATVALILPLLALTACGGEGDGVADGSAPVSGANAAAVAPPAGPPKGTLAPGPVALGTPAGFTPLPSPQQVVGPMAGGRGDPFAPLPPSGAASASLPSGFLFTGVIQSRGLTQAIVYLGGTDTTISETMSNNVSTKLQKVNSSDPTTTICVGPRGLCPGGDPQSPPLPPGWSVTRIDLRNGLLSLRQGSLPVTCRLVQASLRPPNGASKLTSSCTGPGVKAATAPMFSSGLSGPPGPANQGTPQNNPANTTPAANGAVPPTGTQAPNAAPNPPR